MAAVLHSNDKVLVTAVSTYCGQTCMNTFPFIVEVNTGEPPAAEAITSLVNLMKDAGRPIDTLRSCMPQNCIIREVWGQVLGPTRLRAVKVATDLPGNFVDLDGLTANVQASMERFGELANRHNIGALRIPIGTDDTCFDDGEITPAMLSAITLLGTAYVLTRTLTGTGWNVTFKPAVGVSKLELDWVPCVGTLPQQTVRVIRRRTVRVGI